jgi:O-antigen/teichoic acid export membrane protein
MRLFSMLQQLMVQPKARKVLLQYGAYLIGGGVSYLLALFLARRLGPESFGELSFAINTVTLSALVFECGWSIGAGRRMAVENDPGKIRELAGAVLLVVLLLGLVYWLCLEATAGWIDLLFGSNVRTIVHANGPLLIGFLAAYMLRQISEWAHLVAGMAIFQTLPWLIYLSIAAVGARLGWLTSQTAIRAYAIGTIVSSLVVALLLRPDFRNIRGSLSQIRTQVSTFGLHIYLNRLIGTGAFMLDIPILMYFHGRQEVSLYAVSKTLAAPVALLSTSMGDIVARDMARQKEISPRLIRINAACLLLAGGLMAIAGPLLVRWFFSNSYEPAIPMLYVQLAAVVIAGLYMPYNRFLVAQGKGKLVLRLSIIFALSNLVSMALLIPHLGGIGATWANISVNAVWLLMCYGSYRHLLRSVSGKIG